MNIVLKQCFNSLQVQKEISEVVKEIKPETDMKLEVGESKLESFDSTFHYFIPSNKYVDKNSG